MKLPSLELEELLQSPKLYSDGENFKARCPRCGRDDFFIAIDVNNHPFQCWRKETCGFSGNIYTLLADLGLLTDFLASRFGGKYAEKIELIIQESSALGFKPLGYDELPSCQLPLAYRSKPTHSYMDQRQVTNQARYEFGISLDPSYRGYLIFPIKEALTKTIGYISRATEATSFLRYKNSVSDFGKMLYGYDELQGTKTCVLVEGIFDKFSVDRVIQEFKLPLVCLSTFGASISPQQVFKLIEAKVDRIIFMYDPDAIYKTISNSSKLIYYFNEVLIASKLKLDPGDSSNLELIEALYTASTANNFKTEKLILKLKS